jgi:single-strand DNA-binding protein
MALRIPSQNQVLITGRLTRDPEYRSTQKGVSVCFFDIASNRRYKIQSTGEWKEETTYVPVVLWGPIADRCRDKIKRGTPVYIEGRLSQNEYTNKEGKTVKRLRVVANKIQILEVSDSSEAEEVNDAIIDGEIEEIKTSDADDEIPF